MNNEFKGLRHYIDIVESAQTTNEGPVLDATGQLLGAVGGTAKNAVTGAWDAVKSGVSGAVDAAGNAINSVVQPVVQGAQALGQGVQKGYAATQGAHAAGQSANPTAKPQAKPQAKGDPAVLKLQQDLIAKGAKIKADGIMGPATQAAQKQFGGAAAAATTAATPAAPAAAPAAAAPAAPAPGMQAVGDDEGNTTITRPDGSTMVVGPNGQQIMPGSNPNLPQNQGMLNTMSNKLQGKGEFQKPTGFIPANESVGYDEVQRLVSLVQYK